MSLGCALNPESSQSMEVEADSRGHLSRNRGNMQHLHRVHYNKPHWERQSHTYQQTAEDKLHQGHYCFLHSMWGFEVAQHTKAFILKRKDKEYLAQNKLNAWHKILLAQSCQRLRVYKINIKSSKLDYFKQRDCCILCQRSSCFPSVSC